MLIPSSFAKFVVVLVSALNCFVIASIRDRHFCSCRTSLAGSSGSEHGLFSFMLNKLQCCQGVPVCKPIKTSLYGGEYDLDDYSMVCFSDISCVRQDAVVGTCNSRSYGCSNHSILKYKISNPFGEHSYYNCYPMPKKSNDSICLLPYCDNFQAIQRKCHCEKSACTCYGSAEVSIAEVAPETPIVFLAFSDNFVTRRGKNVFLTVLVATLVSFLMLSFLLVAFKWLEFPKWFLDDSDDELHIHDNPISNISNVTARTTAKLCTPSPEIATASSGGILPSYDEAVQREKEKFCERPPEYSH